MSERAFPEVKVHYGENRSPHGVVCQSTRDGAKIQLGVLHDTQGGNIPKSVRDLSGLGGFFDELPTQASSTVGVDSDGHSGRYVPSYRKAWAQAFYNHPALSIEQIGFTTDDWGGPSRRAETDEAARWIALWCHVWNLPIRKGKVTRDGRIIVPGWLQHRDLGNLGGGHVDVNPKYPLAHVLRRARHFYRLQAHHPDTVHAIAASRWEKG